MILERFYDEQLAQASYLIGCAAAGAAVVIDPNRDVEQYRAAAERHRVRVTHVTETHIHADFVSGARELARATGAELLLSAEGGADWQYAYAEADGATLLREGDRFHIGGVQIDVWHTPGHTPEHLVFILTDRSAADRPIGVLTGDFVFVGDVGRPDLLERAARIADTMEASARQLFRSLRRFETLPDYLQVWPGHGAGSACGKALGAMPQSTVGYEKRVNPAVAEQDEERFVAMMLEGQPEPPRYFATMKRINRDGPPILGAMPRPPRIADADVAEVLGGDGIVVDTRDADSFVERHLPGTIHIAKNRSFTTWAGWLLEYEQDIYLIAPDEAAAHDAARDLAMIGLDRVQGWIATSAIDAWERSGRQLDRLQHATMAEVPDRLAAGTHVVDVRNPSEWRAGHVPGVPNVPLGELSDRTDELPRDRPVAVHCQGGARAVIAASLLQAAGFTELIAMRDGFAAWKAAGGDVEGEGGQAESSLTTI